VISRASDAPITVRAAATASSARASAL